MKKDKYKNLIFAYTVLYTFVTVLNSILYLYNGIYEDPSGNWHEIDRAIIVLIGVVAYALVTELVIKPMVLRYADSNIPTKILAFFVLSFFVFCLLFCSLLLCFFAAFFLLLSLFFLLLLFFHKLL